MKFYYAGSVSSWEDSFFTENELKYNRLISLAYKSDSELKRVLGRKERELNDKESTNTEGRVPRSIGKINVVNEREKPGRRIRRKN